MLMPCEELIKKFLPAIRVAAAKKLAKEGMSQMKIANSLGITQAAVSNYLSGNYAASIKKLEQKPEVKSAANKIAKMVSSDSAECHAVKNMVCIACSELIGSCGATKKKR